MLFARKLGIIHILCSIILGGKGKKLGVNTWGEGVQRTSILMLHNLWMMPYRKNNVVHRFTHSLNALMKIQSYLINTKIPYQ
jgi:hypothetical protein